MLLATTQISEAVAAGLPIEVVLINYTKKGSPFTNQLTLEPLCLGPTSPGRITHYVGTVRASSADPAPQPSEPLLSASFECMGVGAQSTAQMPATSAETQSLACRQLAEDLLAANGDAPVTLPQLVRQPIPHTPLPLSSQHAHIPHATTLLPRAAIRDRPPAAFRDGQRADRADWRCTPQ